jgi:hypothetical protein
MFKAKYRIILWHSSTIVLRECFKKNSEILIDTTVIYSECESQWEKKYNKTDAETAESFFRKAN